MTKLRFAMQIIIHEPSRTKIAEITGDGILVGNAQQALQLLVDVYYNDIDKMILHEKNLTPDFFDLSTGLAGEILQKFANYRVRLVIVGQFNQNGQRLKEFMYESNKGKQVNFVTAIEEAIARLSA